MIKVMMGHWYRPNILQYLFSGLLPLEAVLDILMVCGYLLKARQIAHEKDPWFVL